MAKPKVYPAGTYPWMIIRHPYGEPRFARDFNAARKVILKDLDTLRYNFRRLQADDSLGLIDRLFQQAEQLVPHQHGSQWVEGLVDPPTGVKYRAEMVRREEF